MYNSNFYPKMMLLVSFFVLGFTAAYGQLEMKLQLIDGDTWGVYARPAAGSTISTMTQTGSGQATVVMPTGFNYTALTSVNGLWTDSGGVIDAPPEDPTRKYVSFGLITAEPAFPIPYVPGTETLLFTFDRVDPCPDTMYLIDCGTPTESDPFCLPNSMNANVGNDLSVADNATVPTTYYYFTDNYAPSAWSCHDCDNDGILDAFEDTNGNGLWDPGIDSSNICDPCDPIHVLAAMLNPVDGFGAICEGDDIDTALVTVDIDGGWPPYTVVLNNGTPDFDTIFNYYSGDTIKLTPDGSLTYQLETIVDSFSCEINTDSLMGVLDIEVHGPIDFSAEPTAVVECSEDGVTFSATATNDGDGTVYFKWQESTDNGTTWLDIHDGAPYDNTDTDVLSIDPIAGLDNNCYRVKIWTDVCDTVRSVQACLDVEGPLTVDTDPANFTVCDDNTATFTASGINPGDGTMLYQWQVLTDLGGAVWTDIPTGSEPAGVTYSGETTTTLTINNTDVSMDDWQYRMAIYTVTCDRIFTDAAILDVEGPLNFTLDPADFSNCAGGEVFFWFNYTNPGLGNISYQWQESQDNGTSWNDLSDVPPYNNTNGILPPTENGDTLTITDVVGLDGFDYRVVISTPTCANEESASANLEVSGNITFDTQPTQELIRTCAGNDTTITACASIPQGDFYFYWEFSTDDGATWDSLDIAGLANYDHSSNGATMASGCDILTIHDVTGLEYYWFRAVAVATDCADVVSEESRLLVEGPFNISLDPVNETICSGSPVTFTAGIDNMGDSTAVVEYMWQYSVDNVTFFNVAGTVYGGETTEELTITDVAGLNDLYYRLSATTTDCGFTYTSSAQLTVEGPIDVTSNPIDTTMCYNDGMTFTSTATLGDAGTLSYQWQVSSDGLNWTDVDGVMSGGVYSDFTTTTLSISSVTGLYGLCYRLAFYTGECARNFSDPGCLNIQGPVSITDQPDNVTECSADDVTFAIDILNQSQDILNELYVQYKWQESSDGGSTWGDLINGLTPGGGSGVNGVNSDTLTVMETAGRDNHQFRVLVYSEFCDTIISNPATLFIEGPIDFISEPQDTTECEGNGVSFTAAADNAGLAAISYQWEMSTDNGINYTNLNNGGDYTISGATTTTITFDTVGYALHGNRIRLKAWTAHCDTIYSVYALFDVHGEIGISDHPDEVTACSNEDPVCFEIEAFNNGAGDLNYRWQYQVPGGVTWINVVNAGVFNGASTDILCISDISGLDSIQYRCRIWTSECEEMFSTAAYLVEEGPISFDLHPEDITQCSAESITFCGTASIQAGNSGTIEYVWQASSDGVNYNDLANGGGPGYAGATTDCLTITDVAGLNGWLFRLSARTSTCSFDYSFPAGLTVEGPLGIGLQPVAVQNCADAEALFLSQIDNQADPNDSLNQIDYQWQILMPGGTWEDLTNGDTYNGVNTIAGANTDTLLVTPLTGLNGAMVRMKGWTGTCDTLTTDEVEIAVEGPLSFTDQPDDVTLCSSEPVQFTVAIDNLNGVGTVQYQWEMSVDGIMWNDMTNTGLFNGVVSGATTNQVNISNTDSLYNYRFRCKIRTGTCDWEFSTLAQLFVEGPIAFDVNTVDTTICSNVGIILDTEVSLPASSSGALNFQWQVSSNSGGSWANLTNGQTTGTNNAYNGDATDFGEYQGTTSEDLYISLLEGQNNYMYRLVVWTSTCNDTSYEMTLNVLDACLDGTCDFDLDGTINNDDLDDDDDQLDDVWEDYLNNNNVTDGWYYITEVAGGVSTQGDATTPVNQLIYYSNCDVDSDNDGYNDNQEDPDGDEINNGEETDGDGVFDGDPLDPCDPILGPTCIGISLAIDVYLQGANIGNGPSVPMRDDLRQIDAGTDQFINEFPDVEPYSTIVDNLVPGTPETPFVHLGDGGGEDISGTSMLSITGQDAVVDWVFVELRASTDLDSVITTRAALLQADGDVVDVDGVSDLTFINAPAGPYYVVVRHRNHLGVMTAEAMDLSPITSMVDFTDPSTPTYGDYTMKEINGVTYLWAGDFNADDRVVYQGPGNDINYLFADVVEDQSSRFLDPNSPTADPNYDVIANWITLGYKRSDINLDGMCIYQGPNNDRQLMFFQTTLSHPLNTDNIANFVIPSTLP